MYMRVAILLKLPSQPMQTACQTPDLRMFLTLTSRNTLVARQRQCAHHCMSTSLQICYGAMAQARGTHPCTCQPSLGKRDLHTGRSTCVEASAYDSAGTMQSKIDITRKIRRFSSETCALKKHLQAHMHGAWLVITFVTNINAGSL